jgi:oxygen-independent coproporphyrinogen-3 oxidase
VRNGTRERASASLYVHFPLCEAKCTYCDFYSIPGAGHDRARIEALLLTEAEQRAPWQPSTVFLGGGTPSYHDPAALLEFLDRLHSICGFRDSATEVTAECNPESLDLETAQALREGGVSRLSIGIQSLRSEILEQFGRTHSVDQGFQAVDAAKRAGFERLSTDLIYAIPGQSVAEWSDDLRTVLELGLSHLSAYNLTFEPGTAIDRLRREGRLAPSDEEVELELFWRTRELAEQAGLDAYEISNFSLPGHECTHNLSYWQGEDYVGIGPSAVSRAGAVRSGNVRSLPRWMDAIAHGRDPIDSSETLSPLAILGEGWWLGLRTGLGVSAEELQERAGVDPANDPTGPTIGQLTDQGLLVREGDRVCLSPTGLPLADAIGRAFLDCTRAPHSSSSAP